MLDDLTQHAKKYNSFLMNIVNLENIHKKIGNPQYIYDLSRPKDVSSLKEQGHNIRVLPIDFIPFLDDQNIENWVFEQHSDSSKEVDYKPVYSNKKDLPQLSEIITGSQDLPIQLGVCAGKTNTNTHELEIHPSGIEGLVPFFLYNGITILTPYSAYNADRKEIDISKANIVIMPPGFIYLLDKEGHYMPHLNEIMGIVLPDGTGSDRLNEDEKATNEKGLIFTGHNLAFFSDREAKGTTGKVVGKTPATELFERLQKIINN